MSNNISQLIKGCIKGKRTFQKELFLLYNKSLYAVSLKYIRQTEDAQEVLQDSWVEIFKSLESYSEQGKLEGWMKTIVIRTAWKKIRSRKKFEELEMHDINNNINPNSQWMDKMTCEEILNLLDFVPTASRMVFKLFILDQFSHSEIAQQLEITESTSRAHLTKARKILKEKFTLLNNVSRNGIQAI